MAVVRAVDILFIWATLWLATLLTHVPWQNQYTWLGVTSLFLFEFYAEYNEVYYTWRGAPWYKEAMRIIATWTWVLGTLFLLIFFTHTAHDFSRLVLGSWGILAPVSMIFGLICRRFILRYLRTRKRHIQTVAIVGANELGKRLADALAKMPWLGYRFLGYYDDRVKAQEKRRFSAPDTLIRGRFDHLYQDARQGAINIIFVTLPLRAEARIQELVKQLADSTITVYIVPDFFVFDLLHAKWTSIQGIPAVSVYDTPFYMLDGAAKRIEDIVLSSLILILMAIPMLLIALGVKWSGPGPVIFKQRRYGIRGEKIEVWKFRTMTVCEDEDRVEQARQNDNRITRFGKFLRRTSLDELPQFINVLQGRMSVVGPRPHAVAHNEYYRSLVYGYMLRHKVKPGITGLAQIKGFRGETNSLEKMQGRVQYDLEYIQQWSLLLDCKIVLLTIVKGFIHKHAY